MIVGGCDVGSLTTKAIVLRDGRIAARAVLKSRARPSESAEAAMGEALEAAGLALGDLRCAVGTGYGRERVAFAREVRSEIACHAKGARWLLPTARTIIDVGGQDCKVMRLDERGEVERFATNDKCAAGTGRFLDVMARVLGVPASALGALHARARHPVTFANACTVWAQADVIRHLHDGVPPEDIAAGVNAAMAARMATLVNSLGVEPDVCMTGGVAKNDGVLACLQKLLDVRMKRLRREDPQLAGALGAALYAAELAGGGGA